MFEQQPSSIDVKFLSHCRKWNRMLNIDILYLFLKYIYLIKFLSQPPRLVSNMSVEFLGEPIFYVLLLEEDSQLLLVMEPNAVDRNLATGDRFKTDKMRIG